MKLKGVVTGMFFIRYLGCSLKYACLFGVLLCVVSDLSGMNSKKVRRRVIEGNGEFCDFRRNRISPAEYLASLLCDKKLKKL